MKSKRPAAEVAIIMGSDSDWEFLKDGAKTLQAFGVLFDVHVMSAHRTPDAAARFAKSASGKGLQVILAAAGGAAHLAGVIAGHTILPVIGIPVKGGALNGMDALLSMVQMPAGIPVATVTLGSAGPVNAALLAIQILALSRPDLARRLVKHKQDMKHKVTRGHVRVQKALAGLE